MKLASKNGARDPGARRAVSGKALSALLVGVGGAFAVSLCACITAGGDLPPPAGAAGPSPQLAAAVAPGPPDPPSPFKLKPEWDGPCKRAETVDVNLGNAPEAFVRAAHCQITGKEPPPKTVELWAAKLRKDEEHVRRIDVVRTLAKEADRDVTKLAYSDPWESEVELLDAPVHATKRDIGAVFMFFFGCPGATNCEMNWANTHAPGMDAPSPAMGAGPGQKGFYAPTEVGFWRRELSDAKYAGLQFLMLNTYGPDIEDGKLAPLAKALEGLDHPIQIALFDDTWTWGQPYFGEFWKQKPNLRDTEKTATLLYEAKWRPFFRQIDKKHWYRFKGRPFIYFYNSGTLLPADHAAAVLRQMKAKFKEEFGEEPFVDVDTAYFADQDMPKVADARFTWVTFNLPDKLWYSRLNGHTVEHAMVRWDAVGRDRPKDVAKPSDRLIKDGSVLKQVLSYSSNAELLILATWNDLGEGTGVNRNYDYYAGGRWLEPDYFMRMIRASQSGHQP